MSSGPLNGIEVRRNSTGATGGTSNSHFRVDSIRVTYEDGRSFTFIPESNEEFFGQDELLMIADRLLQASRTMEWREVDKSLTM